LPELLLEVQQQVMQIAAAVLVQLCSLQASGHHPQQLHALLLMTAAAAMAVDAWYPDT
jgi:hypothetical protein